MRKKQQIEIWPDGAVLRKKKSRFNPSREEIQAHMEQYFADGGEIDVLEPEPNHSRDYMYRSPSQGETIYEFRL